jgi:hypothetical protein
MVWAAGLGTPSDPTYWAGLFVPTQFNPTAILAIVNTYDSIVITNLGALLHCNLPYMIYSI